MLEKELETAIVLAQQASKTILEFYALEIIAEEKLGVDNLYEPVTIADKTASRIIVDGLAEHFPDDAILSEEEPDDTKKRLARSRVWFIDPIDGTAGFVKKEGDFAVQIGLAICGEPVLGVVLLPFHGVLYHAVKGSGAFARSDGTAKQLHASKRTDYREMYIATSRNHRSKITSQIRSDFGLAGEVQRGSVGLKIGLIAEQVCDLYIHPSPRTKFWDTCGPQVILEEAGGKLTDVFGYPIRYDVADVQNHNGLFASNGVVHERTVRRLRPILNEVGRHRILAKAN
ncbi:MAG TPA: 3'(2'),5'-bisphosphate nucleotidase CysQ [Pyrinomonadaceae bacterium]|nr:3'(2'),5'-bisphosphate nucleotidase CysQ [Pyrinomonadaceae bacterium]